MSIIIEKNQVLLLFAKALKCYNQKLMDHGTRVAYISFKLLEELEGFVELDKKTLFVLSSFHDIGAYKTEEIDSLLAFETKNVMAHCIYGYLFIKYYSPLGKSAEAILHHHSTLEILKKVDPVTAEYAQIVNLADRVDVGNLRGFSDEKLLNSIIASNAYKPRFIEALKRAILKEGFFPQEDLYEWADKVTKTFNISDLEAKKYIEMLIYSIDFKSPITMLHSVNATTISMFLGAELGASKIELEQLYYGALVHDIGKIAIPYSILEFAGRYNEEQATIMRDHISYTSDILKGVFSEKIVKIAARHHEKLDGTGYPEGLKEKDLSLQEQIVMIADILSALLSKRSYKESFDWELTLKILQEMANDNKLNKDIVELIVLKHNEIQNEMDEKATPIINKFEKLKAEYSILVKKYE